MPSTSAPPSDVLDVLVVEDDAATASALAKVLSKAGYRSQFRQNLSEALTAVNAHSPRLVLLDLSLPDGSGLGELVKLKQKGVQEVIVVSGTDSPEYTRQCLAAGAFDFISKPANASEVVAAVRRADMQLKLDQVSPGTYPFALKPGFGSLEGDGIASGKLFRRVKSVARKLNCGGCLITGPAGALKTDIAASVQYYKCSEHPAFLVNCAGENDDYALQRFTQGTSQSGDNGAFEGYLSRAQGGSLVLDDITSLRMDAQVMLAHYLADGLVTPMDSPSSYKGECAIIGILRENPETAIEEGRLHAEFYNAMATNPVAVPGLQARSDDIDFFAEKAVQQLNTVFDTEKGLSDEFLVELRAYAWPGNLVEFRNLILMAYRLTEPGEELSSAGLFFAEEEPAVHPHIAPFIGMSLRDAERQLVQATLAEYDNNKRKVAEVLGVSVKTLYNRLKSYEEESSTA